MIEIELNNKKISVEAGEKIINITDNLNIDVPRFCYHKHLSISANCRMCLVEVEGAPKPQPACSTPVMEGMKIHTKSEVAVNAQKAVMEMLLINHPLDCPICDQAGECELQDVAVSYGSGISHFSEGKRTVANKNLGPLIQTDMTRCIHCSRCVRFGQEIAGVQELGMTGRGENIEIEPFIATTVNSELSGNMIDVCPVGALTSKPFRYQTRSWQLKAKPSIARHDCLGSNLIVQNYKNSVKRVVALENEAINQTWISDRDRFSYTGIESDKRLSKPKIKVSGQWQEVDWDVALDFAFKGLDKVVKQTHGKQLAGLSSANATLEELYVFQKLVKGLGSKNIDFRLNNVDLTTIVPPQSSISLSDLANQKYSLFVGGNPRLEQPMLNHRLRQQTLNGGICEFINITNFDFNYESNQHIVSNSGIAQELNAILEVLKSQKTSGFIGNVAKELSNNKENAVLILGSHIAQNQNAGFIYQTAQEICKLSGANLMVLSEDSNVASALIANVLPEQDGLNASEMLDTPQNAYLLLDIYPQYDCVDVTKAITAFKKSDFVCCLNAYQDDVVDDYADVILPISTILETAGSLINFTGELQSFEASVNPQKDIKSAWKVLKVLADKFELTGFDWINETQVCTEATSTKNAPNLDKQPKVTFKKPNNIEVVWQVAPYAKDSICRHSEALQQSELGQINEVRMNSNTTTKIDAEKIYQGITLNVDNKMADDTIFVWTHQAKPMSNADDE
jgi:NADH-quinone oxidoreductase subunit G